MTERPPNEVAAALVHHLRINRKLPVGEIVQLEGQIRVEIDRLAHELSEARVALAKAEGERDRWKIQSDDWQKRGWELGKQADAAEASYRSHAEAIGVLRGVLEEIKACRDEFASRHVRGLAHDALSLPVPEVAAQVERERRAEREAALIEAARAMCPHCANDLPMSAASTTMHQVQDGYGKPFMVACSASPIRALAALPASPPSDT